MKGTIIRFVNERGFGFIGGEDGNQYFVHIRSIDGLATGEYPPIGQRVQFCVMKTTKGLEAVDVHLIET